MSRLSVRLTSGCVALASSLACTDASNPIAAPPRASTVAATAVNYPYAQGVHVAALPGLDVTRTFVNALNDFGELVGGYTPNSGGTNVTPMKYQTTRGRTLFSDTTLDGQAMGVNNKGQVAVWKNFDFGPSQYSAFIWGWSGDVHNLRNLSTFGSPWCAPWAINNDGVVAGSCLVPGHDSTVATIWTPFGTPWALRASDGQLLYEVHIGAGISDAGYVSGQLANGTGFVFSLQTNQLRVLPEAVINGASVGVYPFSVNNLGQAAGDAPTPQTTSCTDHTIVWLTPGAAGQDLGFCGEPKGITDDGIVIASLFGPPDANGQHPATALIWTASTGTLRLPGLEGGVALTQEQSNVIAINHNHQIVGMITTSDGVQHAVMWTLPAKIVASPETPSLIAMH